MDNVIGDDVSNHLQIWRSEEGEPPLSDLFIVNGWVLLNKKLARGDILYII
jgi:hypothetical protein